MQGKLSFPTFFFIKLGFLRRFMRDPSFSRRELPACVWRGVCVAATKSDENTMMRGTPARRFHGDDIAMRGPPPVSIDLDTSSPRAAPRRVKSASPSERFEETRPSLRDSYRGWTIDSRAAIYIDNKQYMYESELRSEIASLSSQRKRMQRAHSASSLTHSSGFSRAPTRESLDDSGRFSLAQLDKWSRNAPTLLTRTTSRAALEARQQALAMETFISSRAATPKASHHTRRDGAGRERANGADSRRHASTKRSASSHSNSPPPPQLKLDTSRLHLIAVTRDGFGKNPAMETSVAGKLPSVTSHDGALLLNSWSRSWPPTKPGQWSVPLSRSALHQLGAPAASTYLPNLVDLARE